MENRASRRAALIAITMMSFASPFMLSGVNIALPAIGREFGASAVLLAWITNIFSLATAILLVPAGKLADIHGRKRLFILGTVIYTFASVLCALAPSVPMLIVFRGLQGMGAALIFATGTAILTSVFPANERGRVLGITTAAVYVGLSAGPFLGGSIVELVGWRGVFWANIPLALMTLTFTLTRVHGEWADSPDDTFDVRGSLIYALAVTCLITGFGQLPAMRGVWLIVAGLVAGGVFLWHQGHVAVPVLDLSIFRGNRYFSLSSITALVDYAATSSVTFLLSLYLQYIKALSPAQAGLVMISQPIVQAIFSPVAGRLSDRFETRYVASAGMVFTVAGILLLSVLTPETPVSYIVLSLMVLGFGFAFFSAPNTNALMSAVRRRHYGVASGLVASMRTFGQMLSLGMVMILFTYFMGSAQITPEVHGAFMTSTRTAFAIAAVLSSLGVVASLLRGRNPLEGIQEAPVMPGVRIEPNVRVEPNVRAEPGISVEPNVRVEPKVRRHGPPGA